MSDKPVPICPSAPPQAGALLLGRFTEGGSLALAASPLPVTSSFLAKAEEMGQVGKRFRFASPCMHAACSRWQNGKCCVAVAAAEVASNQADQLENPPKLPDCPIRPQCRWFAQEGAPACRICPLVVYDMNDKDMTSNPLP